MVSSCQYFSRTLCFYAVGSAVCGKFHGGRDDTLDSALAPCFLYVFLANWLTEMGMAQTIAQELGSNYVPVRPDELASLYGRYAGKSRKQIFG